MKHSDPLLKKIKQTLDQHTLDADTTRRLAQARHNALQQSQPWWRLNYTVPALALASLLAIVVMINQQLPDQSPHLLPDSIDTFEIISSSEELEMLENLEFYVWLEQQPIDNG